MYSSLAAFLTTLLLLFGCFFLEQNMLISKSEGIHISEEARRYVIGQMQEEHEH